MSNLHGNNSKEHTDFSIVSSRFFTSQAFVSRHELLEWVQNKAFSLGYVIVTKRSKVKEGDVCYVTLMCDRGGEYKVKETSKKTGTKKTNCQFQLVGSYSKRYDGWMLRVICDKHNHPPAQHLEGHAYARRLKENEKKLLADLTSKNVTPRDILSTLKEQDENNVSTLKTVYNAREKLRSSQNIGKTPMQVLMSLLSDKHFLIEFYVNNISNALENLFFIHPQSLDIWRAFPHVLIIDPTYKTNRYDMPYLQIVGVTSTNKTFSIAFAFIINEKEENYNWALACLKSTLEECMHPRVIVTDRELALMNACQQVFPDAARLLCRWHITENIRKKYRKSFKSKKEWDSFRAMWTMLVDSSTWIVYAENYEKLQTMLTNFPRVLKYLNDTWLNDYKEMFVSVWIDQHLNFGERTTNRVESQHAKLKRYLCANSSLDTFVGCIDQIVKSQLTSINASFEKSRIILKHEHNLPCFKLLRGLVALEALDILVGEIKRSSKNQLDSSNCGCKIRHSCGLPCACMLSAYVDSNEFIPLDSIDVFWRKLDFSPSGYVKNEDICCDVELEKIKETFSKQSNAGKKSLLRKLRDIFQPSKTLIKEPKIQKSTRGRPKIKKQQQKQFGSTSQVPRRRSYSTTSKHIDLDEIDLHNEPPRGSSYATKFPDLNHEPSEHLSDFDIDLNQSPADPLMKQIPNIFHPYITEVQDVRGDGNCGFRAISVCLGYGEDQWLFIRHQLIDELVNSFPKYSTVFYGIDGILKSLSFYKSPAPEEHWMVMPETGVLIANRFGVILHYLTIGGCATYFPLWKGPEEFQYHQVITISHVNNNNYVMVKLEGEYPMPPVSALWARSKISPADGWQTMYKSRLDVYKQLIPTQTTFIDLGV